MTTSHRNSVDAKLKVAEPVLPNSALVIASVYGQFSVMEVFSHDEWKILRLCDNEAGEAWGRAGINARRCNSRS